MWFEHFWPLFWPVFSPTNLKMFWPQRTDKNEHFIPGDHFVISSSWKAQKAIFLTVMYFSSDFSTFLMGFDDILENVGVYIDEKSEYRQTLLEGSQAWWVLSIWIIFIKSGQKSGQISSKMWKMIFHLCSKRIISHVEAEEENFSKLDF